MHFSNFEYANLYYLFKLINIHTSKVNFIMPPIFKCLICRRDIERSTKTFWVKRGHLLCSTCLDKIEKNSSSQD